MDIVKIFNENGFRLRDGLIDKYVEMRYNTYCAVTMHSSARELTHVNYTKEYSSKKAEINRSSQIFNYNNLYNHDLISDAIVRLRSSNRTEISSVKVEKKPFLVPSSPENHTSPADHPFFKDYASQIKRAIIIPSGCCTDTFISSLDPDIPLIIVVGSTFTRAIFDFKIKKWFIPIELFLSSQQARSVTFLSLKRVDIDFRKFSIVNSKMPRAIFQASSHIMHKEGTLQVVIHNYEEVFGDLSFANRGMRHLYEGRTDHFSKARVARKRFAATCSSWIVADMITCCLFADEYNMCLLETQDGIDQESRLPYIKAHFGIHQRLQ
ncbi:hypothetical protein [Legionella norrlandica]|nr:hypothetical protein [Legionella norrlandica]